MCPSSRSCGDLLLLEQCWNSQNQNVEFVGGYHSELVFPSRGQRGKNLTSFGTGILGLNWLEMMENLLMKIIQTLVLCVNQVSLFLR